MTSDETPADTVVEQAWGEFRDGPDYQPSDRYDVRSVFEAGFRAALADLADRDERRNEAYRAQLARADRAEAEVADLVAEGIRQKRRANDAIAEVAELRAELRVTTNERDRARAYGRELRAMIDRVRALADEWTNDLKSYPNRAVEVRRDDLRAALDGGGQQ